MTPEAEKFLRKLIKQDPGCCYEWVQEGDRIVSVKLRQTSLTEEQIKQLIYYAKNGAPAIIVEWRAEDDSRAANGISAPYIFIDESKGLTFKEQWRGYKIARKDKKLWTTGTVPLHSMSKDVLTVELLIAEREDNFERCAEIRDLAASKGWQLKKE